MHLMMRGSKKFHQGGGWVHFSNISILQRVQGAYFTCTPKNPLKEPPLAAKPQWQADDGLALNTC